MNGVFIEETIDMMKDCLERLEAIRDENMSAPIRITQDNWRMYRYTGVWFLYSDGRSYVWSTLVGYRPEFDTFILVGLEEESVSTKKEIYATDPTKYFKQQENKS